MVAAKLLDDAKTVRVAPECAATVTLTLVNGDGEGGVTDGEAAGGEGLLVPATKDAKPPGGWLAMDNWNPRWKLVEFCTKITKARCSVVLSGLEFCGEETYSPCVMRLS